jgi:hypothetical protein
MFGYALDIIKAALPFLKNPKFLQKLAGVKFQHPIHNSVVADRQIIVRGNYRWLFGMKLALFHVRGNLFWPQGSAQVNPTQKQWEKDVWIGETRGEQYTIVVAAVTDDVRLTLAYYEQVHWEFVYEHKQDKWFPFRINPHDMPPGLVELDRVTVTWK